MTRTAWWVVLALASVGWAEGAKPELRVDPGCHTSDITGLCFLNGDRQLATTATDDVLRVWDVRSGALVRTRRLHQNLPRRGLAVTRDRRWLAVGTNGQAVVVCDASDLKARRALPLDGANRLMFAGGGRLLVSSDCGDGFAVGDVEAGTVAKLRLDLGERPTPNSCFSSACSPDGRQAATGMEGAVVVQPLSGGRARLLSGLTGNADALAWLSDSRRLLVHTYGPSCTLSLWDTATETRIREWDVDSGMYGLVLSADDQCAWVGTWACGVVGYYVEQGVPGRQLLLGRGVRRLAISEGGDLLAGATTSGGGYAIWDLRRGTLVCERETPASSATAVGWRKADGAIGYGSPPTGRAMIPEAPLKRWLAVQTLAVGECQPDDEWCRPVLRSDRGTVVQRGTIAAFQVAGAQGQAIGPSYSYGGGATWLSSGQLAISHGGRSVVVDASTGVVQKALRQPIMKAAALCQSPDGRYLLGSGSDNTLRIWPLTTTETDVPPLLSIFPAKDGNWIAWTEEGYYACTPAAEKWIGWQINRGEDEEPDYYPAAQFREQFYRPDVIMRLLDAGSVAEAVKQADAARKQQTDGTKVAARIAEFAPPKVEILEPADGATVATSEVTVRLRVKDPNNRKVVAIIPLVNGRPLTGGRFILVPSRDPGEQQVTVPLNPGENTISAIATNDAGSTSVPVSVTVRHGAEEQKPAMYAIAVGVSAYANKDYTLRYAAKDATDLADVLKQQSGKLFRKVEVKLLTDQDASQGAVLDALDWLTKQVTQCDYAVVFLAGHGLADTAGEYYFLPSDGDTERLRRTGLHWSQFRTALRALPGKVLLALDTCHSAGATGARKAGTRLHYTKVLRDALSDEVGLITLSSCMPSEVSYEQDEWHNGAFTKALVEALSGQADHNGDGVVTLAELDAYISERVKALTRGRQHATCERPATVRSVLPVVMVK